MSLSEFVNSDKNALLGTLVSNYHGVDQTTTNEAWEGEIRILQEVLSQWKDEVAHIIFEYDIPRLGKRIDVVLLIRSMVFCLEFKVGQSHALQGDIEQVMDYALDLKNFHKDSAQRTIIPILIPSNYPERTTIFQPSIYEDSIYNPLISGENGLQDLISNVLENELSQPDEVSFAREWLLSNYSPTPTIIEAARTLYENHSVEDITRHEADEASTDATISFILDVIEESKLKRQKSICFVTGVPGAGKTLVGLDVAVKQSYKNGDSIDTEDGAVYLSGNGPLVAVLTEALAQDNHKKCKERGERKNLSDSRREVSKFIQIIHRYRDNMLAKIKNPVENGVLEIDPEKATKQAQAGYGEVEHVAIFDEAQRSWTHERIANYLKRGGTYGNKLKVPNFPMSEAEFLIWSLDQREDWAVIICLVGGGQEINTGEAGISEWIKALNNRFQHWNVFISNKLTDPKYAEEQVTELLKDNTKTSFSEHLHLSVNRRSFRAEELSDFVNYLLSFNTAAKKLYQEISAKGYPILVTRDVSKAKAWLRSNTRGTVRTGVLVSKTAARFKPLGVNILPSGDENAVHWFLDDKNDVRSSNFLEDAATEIQVQGLELDYICVFWDADMRCEGNNWGEFYWSYHKFNGSTKWNVENNEERRKYMLNAYRVLLTRARQGMVICIPEGNGKLGNDGFPEDATRLPEFYDNTYKYLKDIGIEEL